MLVAVSGPQSSGKSTVLQELKNLGYNTVERKTSRSILKDWNVTLQQVNSDPVLTTKFQNEIILRKFEDEKQAIKSNQLFFTERSYADLFTFALISLGKDNYYSDWLDSYYDECKEYNKRYMHVFYIKGGHFNPENDGVRGYNQHYAHMVNSVMLDITGKMQWQDLYGFVNYPLTIIKDVRIDLRLKEILEISNETLITKQITPLTMQSLKQNEKNDKN